MLFQSGIEFFGIVIAFCISIVAINTYSVSQNDTFICLGIAYIYISIFAALHLFSFSGMNIFEISSNNLSIHMLLTQKYLESLSFLIFLPFRPKAFKVVYKYPVVFSTYAVVSAAMLYFSFKVQLIPQYFILPEGHTNFYKMINEYVIMSIYVLAFVSLYISRSRYHKKICRYLYWALFCNIASQLLVAVYSDLYNTPNILAHILRFFAFFSIYKAVVESSLKDPIHTLFHQLNKANSRLELQASQLAALNTRLMTERDECRQAEKILLAENQELLRKASEADKLKGEFLANISHELRTPLSVILGAVQLLTLKIKFPEALDKEKTSKHVNIIRQNCQRLLRLVNNLIDITKIDAGSMPLEARNCNIVPVLRDILGPVSEYISRYGMKVEFQTDGEEKITAIDMDKFERIILSLLSNAVKFSVNGGVIRISVYSGQGHIKISVKDNGVGIPKDKSELIFERFGQVEEILTRKHEGAGIGLSMVKALVELHGGSVEVYSEYGKGSEFILYFPIRIIENQAPVSESCPPSRDAKSFLEKLQTEFSDISVQTS